MKKKSNVKSIVIGEVIMQKLESQVLLVIKPEILIRNAKDLYCFKTNKFETTYKLTKHFFTYITFTIK